MLGAHTPLLWVVLVVCLIAAPAHANRIKQIRVGNHATFTRLVFEMESPAGYQVERHTDADGGERLVVTLDASSRSRSIQSKSAGIESVNVEEQSGKAVAQIRLRKSGLPMKEMILSNPPRIVLDFELPAVVAATPKRPAAVKPAPKPKPVAVKPAPKPVAVEPEPVAPVIAAVESLPTAAEKTEAARDEEHRAAVRAMTPGVHKRGEMAPAEPGDPIAGMNAVAGTPGRPDSVEPEAKPVLDPVAPSAARTSAEKRDQQKKKLRSAAKSAPAPKDPRVNMAAIAAVVAAVLIVAVLVVRRIRKRSITSALDVVALAEEAELDAGPAAANESVGERIPVKGFSMDGDSRALEPSLRGTEQNTAAYSLSEVAANETEPGRDCTARTPREKKRWIWKLPTCPSSLESSTHRRAS